MKKLITVKQVLMALLVGACLGVVMFLVLVASKKPPAQHDNDSRPMSLAETVDRAIDEGHRRLESGIRLTRDDKLFLLRAARATLESKFGASTDTAATLKQAAPPNVLSQKAKLFVTLIVDGKTRGCMASPGANLLEQTIGATKNAIADSRFGGVFRKSELPGTRIDITLLLEPQDVTVRSLQLLEEEIEVGIHAFSLERGPRNAFFKSSVPVAHGYNLQKALERLGIKSGLGPQAYRQRATRIRKHVTVHFAESPIDRSLIEIYRYNLPYRQADATREAALQGVRLSCDYMARHTDDDGLITYMYDVYGDKKDNPEGQAPMVRQLASTGIMAAAGSALDEPRYTDAAKRSINRMLKLYYKEDGKQGFGYLQQGAYANIATAAFCLLAITEIGDDKFHAAERDMLIKFIFAMEDTKRGCLLPVYLPDKVSDFERKEVYYPGEALTALMTIYERTKNPKCLALTERVFDYYSKLFDRTSDKESLAPWMSKAYTKAFLATGKRKYADFVLKMNDHLLKSQQRPGTRYPDKIGSFFAKGVSCSAGVFTESITEAYRVAKAVGDKKRMAAYREGVLLACRFLLQCQYRPENMFTARNRAMTLGGVRQSIHDSSIRIDSLQHVACALLDAARYVYE